MKLNQRTLAHLSKIEDAIEHASLNKRIKFKTYKHGEDTINKAKATLKDKYYKSMT